MISQKAEDKPTHFEDRRNWATCFPPKNPKSKATWTGVTVIDGKKFWVNVYEKTAVSGTRYVSVNLQECTEQPKQVT